MRPLLLNSLPKSGTHLAAKLLHKFGYEFSGCNLSSTTIYGRFAPVKSLLRGVWAGQAALDVGLDVSACARTSWVSASLGRVGSGQYAAGHLPYTDGMAQVVRDVELRVLHVVRDPRDVLVSWAHYVPKNSWHYGRNGLLGADFQEQVMSVLNGYRSGEFLVESFPSLLSRALGWSRFETTLVVRFEDLVGPEGGGCSSAQSKVIENIASYVGAASVDPASVAADLFGGTKVFRRGCIGAWRDELEPGLAETVTTRLGPVLREMGYA